MKEKDEVRKHSFDGIQEYDNQLPRWWVGTFVITFVFGFAYWLAYHVYHWQPNQREEYQQNLKSHAQQYKSSNENSGDVGAQVAMLSKKPEAMAEAKTVFMQNCMACHGDKGQGVIGPNLTDDYWIHGGTPEKIVATITNGVPEKGMLTWKGVLSDSQIQKLTAYILSLKGSNPPGAKEPQGNKE